MNCHREGGALLLAALCLCLCDGCRRQAPIADRVVIGRWADRAQQSEFAKLTAMAKGKGRDGDLARVFLKTHPDQVLTLRSDHRFTWPGIQLGYGRWWLAGNALELSFGKTGVARPFTLYVIAGGQALSSKEYPAALSLELTKMQ